MKQYQTYIEMFGELNKAGKMFFDEIAEMLKLKEICDFLEKIINKLNRR